MGIDQSTYQSARVWFLKACDIQAHERTQWLQNNCEDENIRSLVSDWLKTAEESGLDQIKAFPIIDGFEILKQIGSGGSGVVYEARRIGRDFNQLVAIKILENQHPSVVKRFKLEQRILVQLDHPGIARLIDAGETLDGQPYLVMELVHGHNIKDYCQKLNHTDIVKLIIQVLDSVIYAHRHLILHRDLKPANILINQQGAPKLLDFGIAKLLNDLQDTNATKDHQVYTPQFASPEQINGLPLTLATDVYSTGIILYVLLAKKSPYPTHLSHIQLIKRIATDQVDWLESLKCLKCDKDLKAIISKSTRFEPMARYQSVDDLQLDLNHWLAGNPVTALQTDWWYGFSKRVKKHWLPLSVVIAFVALLIWFNLSIQKQLKETQIQRDTAENVLEFLENTYDAADPEEKPGQRLTVREVLLEGAKNLDQVESLQARIRVATSMAKVFNQLELFDEALSISQNLDFVNQLELQRQTIIALIGKNEYQQAIKQLDLIKSDDAPKFQLLKILALMGLEEYQKAMVLVDQALNSAAGNTVDEIIIQLRISKSNCWYYLNDLNNAQLFSQQTLELAKTHLGKENFTYINALHDAAYFNQEKGHYEMAEQQFLESIRIERMLRNESTVGVAISLDNLATVQTAMNKLDDALIYRQEALQIFKDRNATELQSHHIVLGNTAHLLEKLGRNYEAIERYREAIDLFKQQPESSQIQLGIAYHNIARAMMHTNDMNSAWQSFQHSKQLLEDQLGAEHPLMGTWWSTIAEYYGLNQMLDKQLNALNKALKIYYDTVGESHPNYTTVCDKLIALGSECQP